jgi:hypothetical protein
MGSYTEFVSMTFVMEECCACGVKFGMLEAYQKKKRETKDTFHCPNGHPQHYTGETEADKLRRERDRLQQQIACVEDEKIAAQRKVKRLEKRAAAGTCPCCQRTFGNMGRHMKTKHPEFVAENVVPLKKKA